jgi:hypothetical protein
VPTTYSSSDLRRRRCHRRSSESSEKLRQRCGEKFVARSTNGVRTLDLFDRELPDGFRYRRDVITPDAEAALIAEMACVPFTTFTMRGVAARRRAPVAPFLVSYEVPPVPAAVHDDCPGTADGHT